MKIHELEWLVENKHLLNEEELQELEDLKLFEQHQKGEISLGLPVFLGPLNTLNDLYEKYNK